MKEWDISINSKFCPFRYQTEDDPGSTNMRFIIGCRLFGRTLIECSILSCPRISK